MKYKYVIDFKNNKTYFIHVHLNIYGKIIHQNIYFYHLMF
jgi:hypothetical protein